MTVIHSTCMTHGVMDGTEVHIFLMRWNNWFRWITIWAYFGSDDWEINHSC